MLSQCLLSAISGGSLSVFLFHKVPRACDPLIPDDVSLERFEWLLDEVLRSFNVLPLKDAINLLQKGRLPRNAACITFDDGYPDWLEGVAPALRRRNLHATFFITSGQFDGVPLWHERIHAAVRSLPDGPLDLGEPFLPVCTLSGMADRQALVYRLERDLKYLSLQRRESILLRLEFTAGVLPTSVNSMSQSQLRDLHSQGFGIGAHTALHPILDYCNPEEVVAEISGARERIETIIGGRVEGFAYPNGRPFADFSRQHVDAVKKAGYHYAVTTHWGAANRQTSPFQIPRFTPWAEHRWHVTFQLMRNLLTRPQQVPEVAA